MPGVITTCAKCGAQYSWNTDSQEYPDCPQCGHNAMKIDKAKRDKCSSAAERGDLAGVKQGLHDTDVRKNLNAGPLTILHHAVLGNQIDVVKYLLSEGAEPDRAYPQADNETPLHIAAARGYPDIAKVLIDAGAKVDAKDSSGAKPLDKATDEATIALLQPYDSKVTTLSDFFAAVRNGETDKVKAFLKEGMDPSVKDPSENEYGFVLNFTALDYATQNEARGMQLAEFLIEHGADVNARRDGGGSVLHTAVLNGRADIAALLLQHGADVNVRDEWGATPLHNACDPVGSESEGREEMTKLLIENGADINAQDNNQETPIYKAAMCIALQEPEEKEQCTDEDFTLLKIFLDAGGSLGKEDLPRYWVTDMKSVPNPAIWNYLKSYALQNPTSAGPGQTTSPSKLCLISKTETIDRDGTSGKSPRPDPPEKIQEQELRLVTRRKVTDDCRNDRSGIDTTGSKLVTEKKVETRTAPKQSSISSNVRHLRSAKPFRGKIVVIVALGVIGAIAIGFITKMRETTNFHACVNALHKINAAKDQVALTRGYANGATVTEEEVSEYISGGLRSMRCRSGGVHSINPIGTPAQCSVHSKPPDRTVKKQEGTPGKGIRKDMMVFTGRLVRPGGAPIPGATILIRGMIREVADGRIGLLMSSTDSEGRFRIEVKTSEMTINDERIINLNLGMGSPFLGELLGENGAPFSLKLPASFQHGELPLGTITVKRQ